LFDVRIGNDIFSDIFALSATIVGPIYALSFVPKKFDQGDETCHAPIQVGFITNWILAPLVIIYMGILYAYFVKIGVNWEIPKGQLSFMITGFIGIGLATYMISWPQRDTGGKLLQLMMKYFFSAMLIPVVMQAISIGARLDQYGFTEKRYVVAISVLWFAFIAVGFMLKKLDLKHIPLSLACLLLLASWGPWSARDVSAYSQIGKTKHYRVMRVFKLVGLRIIYLAMNMNLRAIRISVNFLRNWGCHTSLNGNVKVITLLF